MRYTFGLILAAVLGVAAFSPSKSQAGPFIYRGGPWDRWVAPVFNGGYLVDNGYWYNGTYYYYPTSSSYYYPSGYTTLYYPSGTTTVMPGATTVMPGATTVMPSADVAPATTTTTYYYPSGNFYYTPVRTVLFGRGWR
jgi:hypothetical protein